MPVPLTKYEDRCLDLDCNSSKLKRGIVLVPPQERQETLVSTLEDDFSQTQRTSRISTEFDVTGFAIPSAPSTEGSVGGLSG
jgi:hypothetical protein